MIKYKYDWKAVSEQIGALLLSGACRPTIRAIGRHLCIPYSTLQEAVTRGDVSVETKPPTQVMGEPAPGVASISVMDPNLTEAEKTLHSMGYTPEKWTIMSVLSSEFKEHRRHTFKLAPNVVDPQVPIIRPVKIVMPPVTSKPYKETLDERRQTLVIPDLHFPFQNKLVVRDILNLVKRVSFNEVVILGDILDMTEWTGRFLIEPQNVNKTQDAINEASIFLAELRLALGSEAPIVVLEGNHDLRLKTKIMSDLPALMGLRTKGGYAIDNIGAFLDFEASNTLFLPGYPDNFYRIDERTIAVHGDVVSGQHGGTAAKILNTENNVVFGHIHRAEVVYGPRTWAACPGTICEIDGTVPGSRFKNNWSHGVAIVKTYPDKTMVGVHQWDAERGFFDVV